MPSIYDMGPPALLPHPKGRHTEGFLTLLKNPKASVGFEPVILGTTVQHANHCATEASKMLVFWVAQNMLLYTHMNKTTLVVK